MRETFSTHKAEGDKSKRDRLQSQGAPKKASITLDNVKPPARKVIQDELNQTMQINNQKMQAETIEVGSTAGTRKREGGSEVPKHRRDVNAFEIPDKARIGTTNAPSPTMANTTTANRAERVKGEIIRSRITKHSQSPDKYHLNNNLVVQLADHPGRKPVDIKNKMY